MNAGVQSIVAIGKIAEQKFGLRVSENPYFGGVTQGIHVSDSNHYAGRAIDVTGPPDKLAAFDAWVAQVFGPQLSELFYDPGVNIKHGSKTSAIGNHGDHVHVATEPGGIDWSKVAGLDSGAFKPVGELPGKALDVVKQGASSVAQEVIDGLVGFIGDKAVAAALNVAFVGGGVALMYYGIATMAGVQEPARRTFEKVGQTAQTAAAVAPK